MSEPTTPRVTRLILDAGDIVDMVAELKAGRPFPLYLSDGTKIEAVAGRQADIGDPDDTPRIGPEHGELDTLTVTRY